MKQKFKRILALTLSIMTLLNSMPLSVFAEEIQDNTHEHDTEHIHIITQVDAKDSTCTEDGNLTYWLCECGSFFSDAEGTTTVEENSWVIPASHVWDDGVVTTEPTEETTGVLTYTCTVADCGATKTEDIPTLQNIQVLTEPEATTEAHICGNLVKIDAVTASELQAGFGEYWRCPTCGICFSGSDPAVNDEGEYTNDINSLAHTAKALSGYTWDFSEGTVNSTNGNNSLTLVATETSATSASDLIKTNSGTFQVSYGTALALSQPITLEKSKNWTFEIEIITRPGYANGAVLSTAADNSGIYVYIAENGDLSVVKTMELNGVSAPTYFKVSDADFNNSVLANENFNNTGYFRNYQLRSVDGNLYFWLDGVKVGQLSVYEQTAERGTEDYELATTEDKFGLDTLTVTHIGAGNGTSATGLGLVGSVKYLGLYNGTNTDTCTGHEMIKIDAVAASCLTTGTAAGWLCKKCGNYYADAAGTTKLEYAPAYSGTTWDFTKATIETVDGSPVIKSTDGNNYIKYLVHRGADPEPPESDRKLILEDGAWVSNALTSTFKSNVELKADNDWVMEIVTKCHEDQTLARGIFAVKHYDNAFLYLKGDGDLMLEYGKGYYYKVSEADFVNNIPADYSSKDYHNYQMRYIDGEFWYYLDGKCIGKLALWEKTNKRDASDGVAESATPTSAALDAFKSMSISRVGSGTKDTNAANYGFAGYVKYMGIYTGHTYSGACDTTCNTENCPTTRTVSVEHTWGEGTKQGDKIVYTCTECQETKEEAVITGCQHTELTATARTEPTCTEEGNIAYWTCDSCHETFSDAEATTSVDNVVIPANGHGTYEKVTISTASCLMTGIVQEKCPDCGHVKNVEYTYGFSGHVWDFENDSWESNNGNELSFYGKSSGNSYSVDNGLLSGNRIAYKMSEAITLNRSEDWTLEIEARNTADEAIRGVFSSSTSAGIPSFSSNAVVFVYITSKGDMMIGRGKKDTMDGNAAESYLFYRVSEADYAKIPDDFTVTEYHNYQLRNEVVNVNGVPTRVINYYLDNQLIGPLAITKSGTNRSDAYTYEGCYFDSKLDSIQLTHIGSASSTTNASYGLSGDVQHMAVYTGHSYSSDCDTTCNTEGCGHTRTTTANHTEGEGVVTLAPSGTVDGEMTYYCSGCGVKIRTEVIPAGCQHTELTATARTEPTCTEEGNIAYWTCDSCHETFSDAEATTSVDNVVIPANGHGTYEKVTISTASCLMTGVVHEKCPDCGHVKNVEYTYGFSGHVWDFEDGKAVSNKGNELSEYTGGEYTVANGLLSGNKISYKLEEKIVLNRSEDWTVEIEARNTTGEAIRGVFSTSNSSGVPTFSSDKAVYIYITSKGDMMIGRGKTDDMGGNAAEGYMFYRVSEADYAKIPADFTVTEYHNYQLRNEVVAVNGVPKRVINYYLDGELIGPLAITKTGTNRNDAYTYEGCYFDSMLDKLTFTHVGATNSKGDSAAYGLSGDVQHLAVYSGHAWDHACDKTCNNEGCDVTRETTHTYGSQTFDATFDADSYTVYTCTTEGCGDSYTVNHDGTKLVAAALIGEQKYVSLAEAFANAQETDTIVLHADATVDVMYTGNVTVDFNGFTVTGTLLGTLKLNGGTLITAEGYKMAGPQADYYKTNDAVMFLDQAGNITVLSGTMTLNQNWWTGIGQILTIAEDATFIVPAGIKMNVLSTVIVEGNVQIDGEVNLYNAAATIQAVEGLQNITTTAGDMVYYVDGKYTVHSHTLTAVEAKDSTCLEEGNYAYWTCDVCGNVYADAEATQLTTVEEQKKEKLPHRYGTPTFVWTEDHKCSAHFLCGESNETEIVTCEITYKTNDATCTIAGNVTYTATVTFNDNTYTDEKVVLGSPLGHDYAKAIFEWSEDATSATASVTCKVCDESTEEHTLIGNAVVEKVSSTAGNCTLNSTATYEAVITLGTVEYKATKTVEGEKGEHDLTKTDAVEATCAATGNNAYWTCGICEKVYADEEAKQLTTAEDQITAKKPHQYGEVNFVWDENGESATAFVECANCTEEAEGHKVEGAVTVEQTDATAGDCKTKATTTFTGTVTLNGEIYTDVKVVVGTYGSHNMSKTEATTDNCVDAAHSEYWSCDICETHFADAEGRTEITLNYVDVVKDQIWDFEDGTMVSNNGNELSFYGYFNSTGNEYTVANGMLSGNRISYKMSEAITLNRSEDWTLEIEARNTADEAIRGVFSSSTSAGIPSFSSNAVVFVYITSKGDMMIGRGKKDTMDGNAAESYLFYRVSEADYAKIPDDFTVTEYHNYQLRNEVVNVNGVPTRVINYYLDGKLIGPLAITKSGTNRNDAYTYEGCYFDSKLDSIKLTHIGSASGPTNAPYGLSGDVQHMAVYKGHAWDNACDATCNNAGCTYTRDVEHQWDEGRVVLEPTETTAGTKQFTCANCGTTMNKEIPALNHTHTMQAYAAKAPACETEGNSAYWYCSGCNTYFGDVNGETEVEENSWIIGANGHDWDDGVITKAPTAGANGEFTQTCKTEGCGKTVKTSITAEDVLNIEQNHAWDFSTNSMTASSGVTLENHVGTTSIADGELISNKTIMKLSDSILLDSNKYWSVKVTAKAHDEAIRTIVSDKDKYVSSSFVYINKTGDMMLVKKGGFTADDGSTVASNYTYYKVSDADYNEKIATIENFNANEYHTYELRCENGSFYYWLDGVKIGKLSMSEQSASRGGGKPQYTQGNGTPFSFDKINVNYVGNGNSDGEAVYGLTANVKDFSIATGHVFSDDCDETCNNAGCEYVRDGDHTWNAGVVTKEPTEVSEGAKTYTCTLCSTTKIEVIPVLPHAHTMIAFEAVESACETTGSSAYWKCTICKKFFGDATGETEIAENSWIIKEKGHSWDEGVVVKAPTNNEDGERLYTCLTEGCGKTKTEAISSAGEFVMKYDDRVTVSELGQSGAPVVVSQTVKSKKVGTDIADDAVITYANGKLIAVGVGTAVLDWGEGDDAVTYNFVVEPADISLIMLTGHSLGSGSQGDGKQSIVNKEGQVYSTNESAYAFKLCTGDSSAGTVEGKDVTGMGIGYGSANKPSKIDALVDSGAGVKGADSAIAYRWTQLTGEKVWVLNAAKGSTNLSTWVEGGYNYRHAVELFTTAEEILYNETLAGHYKVNKLGIVNYSTANGDQRWTEEKYTESFNSMWNGFQEEMALYDFDGDNTVDTVDCIGVVPTWSVCSMDSWDNMHKAPLAFNRSGDIHNGKLINYYMSVFGNEGVVMASTAGRSWTTDAGVKAYFDANPIVNMYGVLQNGNYHTNPSTVRNGVYGDGVHYSQLGYNVQGIEITNSMYEYWYDANAVESVKFVQEDGVSEVPETIELPANGSYIVVPEATPSSAKLTFTVEGNSAIYENCIVKGVKPGNAKLIIHNQNGEAIKTVNIKVTEAEQETYEDAVWYVWDFAEGKAENTSGSDSGNVLSLVKSEDSSVTSVSDILVNGTLNATSKTTMKLEKPITLNSSENWFAEIVAKGDGKNSIRGMFSTSKGLSGTYLYINAKGDLSIVRKGEFIADDGTKVSSDYTYYKVSEEDYYNSILVSKNFDVTQYHSYRVSCMNGEFTFWVDDEQIGKLALSEQSAHRGDSALHYTSGNGTPFDFNSLTMAYLGCGSSSNAASQGVNAVVKEISIGSGVAYVKYDAGLEVAESISSMPVVPGTEVTLYKPYIGDYCAKFIGWSETQEGTGTVYKAGDVYTVKNMTPVTLYALWEARDTTDAEHIVVNGVCSYCGAIVHDYTTKVASEEYLCTKETYSKPATYYYSCGCCGASSKGTEYEATFEYGRPGDGYYNVVTQKNWDIAPGITETELVLNNEAGERRQVVHIMEVDISNPYAEVMPSYMGMNPTVGNYKLGTLYNQAKWIEDNMDLNIVGGMNTSLSWYDSDYYAQHPELVGEPIGTLVINGTVYSEKTSAETCLVINYDEKDGVTRPASIPKVELRYTKDGLTGWEEQVIPCNFDFVVKDGKNTSKESHGNQASKSVLGVKADGTIVIMQNDGRLAPKSNGMSLYEIGEVMLNLGCVYAVRCDGGGTSTYISQRPGEELKVNNTPSDGTERTTTTGIVVISTAPSDGTFARASITVDNKYYVPGSKVTFSAVGSDISGTKVDIPSDAEWTIKEENMGTIKNGVFTSNGNTGTVTAQLVYNNKVVGSCSIEIVIPETFSFQQEVITVPFGKTVELVLNATINNGLNKVVLNADDIKVTTDNSKLGEFNGLTFTAVAENKAPSKLTSTITAKIISLPEFVATAQLNIGKGSVVLEDFEDGIDGWHIRHHNSPCDYEFKAVNSETGEVYNGNSAAGLYFLNDSQKANAGSYPQLSILPDENIILENATSIGAWVYIPDDFYNLWLIMRYYTKDADGNYTVSNTENLVEGGEVYNSYEESGWYYFSCDVSAHDSIMISSTNIFLEMISQHTGANELFQTISPHGQSLIYVDDITVDYSAAADDREAPIFRTVTLNKNGTEVDLVKRTTVKANSNVVTVTATVAEDTTKTNATGVNAESAKAYVDDVPVDVLYVNGAMSINNIALAKGTHRVKFEISDYAGNTSTVIRVIEVPDNAGVSTLELVPADPTLDRLYGGSLYWMNLNANVIESIQSVSFDIDLNAVNHWELDHMELAEGFVAEYTVDSKTNTASVVISRCGDSKLTGSHTLASLPIRVIYFDTDIKTEGYTAESFWNEYLFWAQDVEVDIDYGEITFVEGYSYNVLNAFSCPEYSIDTEMYADARTMDPAFKAERGTAHVHDAKALEDIAATCCQGGYSGRTYCDICESVVEWGTIHKATGHNYVIKKGKLTCDNCGELFNGIKDGKVYIDGVIADGWIDNTYYYEDGVMVTGPLYMDEYLYYFDENGIYDSDYVYTGFYETDDGLLMYFFENEYAIGSQYVDGIVYNFDDNGYGLEGDIIIDGTTCQFENGQLVGSDIVHIIDAGIAGDDIMYVLYSDGTIVLEGSGATYSYENRGNRPFSNYTKQINRIVVDNEITRIGTSFFSKTNVTNVELGQPSALKQIGTDAFGNSPELTTFIVPDGATYIGTRTFENCSKLTKVYIPSSVKTIGPDAFKGCNKVTLYVEADSYALKYAIENNIPYVIGELQLKNGIYNEDGAMYYYRDGERYYAGLIKIDGYYYYVNSGCKVVTGKYSIWNTNDLMERKYYLFDEQGRMVMDAKDGIVEEDGALYYYEAGEKTYAGLIMIDGYYYYVNSSCKVVTGKYSIWKTNDLMERGEYLFDVQGRMVMGDKNGIYTEDGAMYYYRDGERYYAGLIMIDGYYYYVNSSCKVVTGKYNIWNTNDLMERGYYLFDEQGRMVMDVKNGIVEEDGTLYYYEAGEKTYAGLIMIDGYYYYVNSKCIVVTGEYPIWTTNGLLPQATYTFGPDGKMLNPPGSDDTVKNGIVHEDGAMYYYRDGERYYAGLIMIDGYYYYVNSSCKVVTGKYNIWNTNDLMERGYYLFDEQGRMVMDAKDGIVEEDGALYYYEAGEKTYAGLIMIDGYYYYVNSSCKVVTGKYSIWKTNDLMERGEYLFDETGKMII